MEKSRFADTDETTIYEIKNKPFHISQEKTLAIHDPRKCPSHPHLNCVKPDYKNLASYPATITVKTRLEYMEFLSV